VSIVVSIGSGLKFYHLTLLLKHGYLMKEIADFLGVHYDTVSRALKEFG